jgi:hypothetical protein
MSGDRLDKGFVNWQGQRVFVPMFGAPRLVPTARDEVRVVKLKFRTHLVMAATFIVPILLLIGLGALVDGAGSASSDAPGTPDAEGTDVVALIVCMVFGVGAILERRHWRSWPRLDLRSFARTRFLWAYFRGQPVKERMLELGLSGLALLFLLGTFREVIDSIEGADPAWWLFRVGVALLALGGFGFLVVRHASMILASFAPMHAASTR